MPTIYSLENIPIEVLRRLAMEKPEQWADAYDNEMVRRHAGYQGWLKKHGLTDSPESVQEYRHGNRR